MNMEKRSSIAPAEGDFSVPRKMGGQPKKRPKPYMWAPEKRKEEFWDFLKQEGIYTVDQDGHIICDIEKIKALTTKDVSEKAGYSDWQNLLLGFFEGKKVIAKQDLGQEDIDLKTMAKPLFYWPKKEDVFNLEAIRRSDFYLSLSDVAGNWQTFNEIIASKFGCSGEEMEMALRIYHPKFASGFRDGNGILMVKKNFLDTSPEAEFVPISSDWLKDSKKIKLRSVRSGNSTSAVWANPKIAIVSDEYKNLRVSGLLTENDFRQTSLGQSDFRRETKLGKKGTILINGGLYNLGEEFMGHLCIQLEPDLYGIVRLEHKRQRLIYVFKPVSSEKLAEIKQATGKENNSNRDNSGPIVVKREHYQIIPFSESVLTKKFADETTQEFIDRSPLTGREYDRVQELTRDLAAKRIKLDKALNYKEQLWLAEYAATSDRRYQKILEFAQKYGAESLKIFVSCEYGEHMGEKIFNIGDYENKLEAEEIFSQYAAILKNAEKIASILSTSKEILSSEITQADFGVQCAEAIMRRAKDMLYVADEITKKGQAGAKYYDGRKLECKDLKEVIEALKTYQEALEKIGALLQSPEDNNKYIFSLQETVEGTPESYGFSVQDTVNGEESYFMLQLRDYGAAYGQHNQAVEYNGEARINFLFFDKQFSAQLEDANRKNALSLRIDREGVTREGRQIIENDPTRSAGELSLDIGSLEDAVGRVVSIGNVLCHRENKNGRLVYPQYYHNRESFAKKLGEAEVFAEIVEMVRKKIKERFI